MIRRFLIGAFAFAFAGAASGQQVLVSPTQAISAKDLKNFGASCNGTTDDTAAFNAALTALSGATNTLHFTGTCILDPTAKTYGNFNGALSLIGDGPSNSTIKLKAGSAVPDGTYLFTWQGAVAGITVSGITFDLNGATAGSTSGGGVLDFVNPSQIMVKNNAIINGGSGRWLYIQAYGANNGEIGGNYLQLTTAASTSNQAINMGSVAKPVSHWDVHDNTIINSGMLVQVGTNIRVCNNEFSGYGYGAGVAFEAVDSVDRGSVICNNWFHDTLSALDSNQTHVRGVENEWYGTQIVGNKFYNIGGPGIANFGGNVNVAGNTIGNSSLYALGPVVTLGAITAGSAYTNGTYTNVSLTGGTGSGAGANIVVAGGVVVSVSMSSADAIVTGATYTVGDVLSAAAADIGGTGSGFSIPVASVMGSPGILAAADGAVNASGSTYTDNTIYDDGGGNTSYCIQDITSGAISSIIGPNACWGTKLGYYRLDGPVTYTTPPTRDNRLDNPCFEIDQRNEGAVVSTNATYGPDRWKLTSSSGSNFSFTRAATINGPGGGCLNSLQAKAKAGSINPAATDHYYVLQAIQQANIEDLDYASAGAFPVPKSVFLEFCALASVAGTYPWAVQNFNSTRSLVGSYTLFSGGGAGSNVRCFSFKIPGESSSLGVTPTNAAMRVVFSFGSGTTELTSTVGAWTAGLFDGPTNTTPLVSLAINSTVAISNVRLYRADAPTGWVPRSFGEEFARAQLYYAKTFPNGTAPAQSGGVAGALCVQNPIANGQPSDVWQFPVPMRIAPTVTTYNPSAANANWRDVTGAADVTVSVDPSTAISAGRVEITTGATVTTLAHNLCIHASANADF